MFKKRNKYLNKKVVVGDMTFDSKKESRRYNELRVTEQLGFIKELVHQPRFPFFIGSVPLKTGDKGSRQVTYVADFSYTVVETGEFVVEDVKSQVTKKLPAYKIKKALMNVLYNVKIKEI